MVKITGKVSVSLLIYNSFFNPGLINANNSDSLILAIRSLNDDTSKANKLNNIAYDFRNDNPNKCIKIANAALNLSEKITYQKGIGEANLSLGAGYINLGQNKEALEYLSKSFEIFTQTGDSVNLAKNYNQIGFVYDNEGDFSKALENYKSALKIRIALGDKKSIAASYNNIGTAYSSQGNYTKALENHFNSLMLNEATKDESGIASSTNNIANIYFYQKDYDRALEYYLNAVDIFITLGEKQNLAIGYNNIGNLFSIKKNYELALKNHFDALKIREEINDKSGIGESLNNIGAAFSNQGKYYEALEYYKKSLKNQQEVNSKTGLARAYMNIGIIYMELNKLREAKSNIDVGFKLAEEVNSNSLLSFAYKVNVEYYKRTGNIKEELKYFRLEEQYKDSLMNDQTSQKISQLGLQYEFDKKELNLKAEQEKRDAISKKEIERQKVIRNGILAGLLIVLLFAAVFFFQRNKIRQEKKKSEALLLNILPVETAEELKSNGKVKPKHYDSVSVMFTDFKDFTKISELMSSDELINEINFCYSEFDKIIANYNLEKIKTIGDSYMCAGGIPLVNTTHSNDAILAGLDICRFMEQLKTERQKVNKPFFEIRIGIHTGPVVAGIVGINKFAFDIWGETVNIASRMESYGEVGKVNVSSTTYELQKNNFHFVQRNGVFESNKGPIKMFIVETT